MQVRKSRVANLTHAALFAAILCIFSPITVYIGQIPVTLSTFAVMLSGIVLGAKRGVISIFVYILLGVCGLPVFSGGQSGIAVLSGPTGGYMWAYPVMVLIVSFSGRLNLKNRYLSLAFSFLLCVLSVCACYILGTVWFVMLTGSGVFEALAVCVYPFIIFDVLKSAVASLLGRSLRKRVNLVL